MNAKAVAFAFILLTAGLFNKLVAQNSMGIGTNSPNPNAVLELVSPTSNQGFLVPRLTTLERGSMSLSANENGLLVFDIDDQLFYFWVDPTWIPVSNGANGDMLASIYDQDGNQSVDAADSISVDFFDGVSIQYNLLTGQVEVRGGGITTTKLANASVTNAKIALGSITGDQLGIPALSGQVLKYDGSGWLAGPDTVNVDGTTIIGDGESIPLGIGTLGSAQIQDGAITTTKIGTAVITGDKIGIPALPGQVLKYDGSGWLAGPDTVNVDGTTITGDGETIPLAIGTIGTTQIQDASITNAKIALGSITGDQLGIPALSGQVLKYDGVGWLAGPDTVNVDGTTIIGDGETIPLAIGTLGTAQIQDASITTAKLADGSVSNAKIATGSITGDQIGVPAASGDVLTYDGSVWAALPNFSSQWGANGSDIYYDTGRVAIGVNAPTAPLHILSSANGTSDLLIQDDAGGDPSLTFEETSGGAIYSMGIDFSDAGKFKMARSSNPSGSAFFTIDASNRFGFGTQTPFDALHAHVGTTTVSRIRLTQSASGLASTDGVVLESNSANAYIRNYENGDIYLNTNTHLFTFSSLGNLTVPGTMTATAFVGDASGLTNLPSTYNSTLTIRDGLTGNSTPSLFLERTDGNSAVSAQYNNGAATFSMGITGDEGFALSAPNVNIGQTGDYLRVTNAGDVGIGTVAPSAKLDVGGSLEVNGDMTTTAGVYHQVRQISSTTYVVQAGDHIIEVSGAGTAITLPDANVPIDGRELFILVRAGGDHSIALDGAAGDFFIYNAAVVSTPISIGLNVTPAIHSVHLLSVGNFWYVMTH
ncbi:hypothetical protein [Marinoscillum sp. MHG1-6]|uniref:hypothetical protein n=1 Tax=Marinoscillum sp. MHG1-6 TaxID=2959627 RepID=UPI0021585BD4|nr:hypothetical protein [Marinoscillum sp. MHG1-6]